MSSTTLPDTPIKTSSDDLEMGDLFEVIDGEQVELPPMSVYAVRVANRLAYHLTRHSEDNGGLGESIVEGLFKVPSEDRNRRPDVAFVTYERWPRERAMPRRGNAWDVVPDLAVEVISPNDIAEDVIEKVDEYFRAGVRLVWVIYPVMQQIYVYRSPTQIAVLGIDGELDGGDVLPGFRVSIADLFPPKE